MLSAALLLCLQEFAKEAFERHVRFLASDEMKGRDNGSGEGGRAAQYVADRLKEAGLKPGAGGNWFQDFDVKGVKGRNVVGLLEGEKGGEVVVVAAHHDGLGVREGKVMNGADDNASGVAMVLELARSFAAAAKPARSMLFISFDAEEDGLVGSKHFVQSELYPAGSFAAMFVFDLIGGDLFEWEKDRIYALGSEHSPELQALVAKQETRGLEVARASILLLEPVPGMARSDYHAFRNREVPFVFFSSGTPWYYHTEHDDPGVLNLGKMVKAAEFARGVIAATVAGKRPTFRKPEASMNDVALVRGSLGKVIAARPGWTEAQSAAAAKLAGELEAMKEPDLAKLRQAMGLVLAAARARPGGK